MYFYLDTPQLGRVPSLLIKYGANNYLWAFSVDEILDCFVFY